MGKDLECFLVEALSLCFLSPRIQSPCLPKFCPISRPKEVSLLTNGNNTNTKGPPISGKSDYMSNGFKIINREICRDSWSK